MSSWRILKYLFHIVVTALFVLLYMYGVYHSLESHLQYTYTH